MSRITKHIFTPAEDDIIRDMFARGAYDRMIADRLCVTASMISHRRKSLGLRKRCADGWGNLHATGTTIAALIDDMRISLEAFLTAAEAFTAWYRDHEQD